MTRFLAAVALALGLAATAAAQHRCAPVQYAAPAQYAVPVPYAAPVQYAAPAYAPPVVKYENVIVVPAAVYTLPGPPTVQLNIYPASQTFVQPVAAPAAVLTPDQAAKAQVVPVQVPPGADVRVVTVPVPVTPSK